MSESRLTNLRRLRSKASQLLGTVTEDLRAFGHRLDGVTFRRQPGQESVAGDVKVTTTCSCLMALALSSTLDHFFEEEEFSDKAKESLDKVFSAPWASSGLSENNPFSTIMVLRTAGFLTSAGILEENWIDDHKKDHLAGAGKSLREIAYWIGEDILSFGIEKYPPTSTVLYWYVDGVSQNKITLNDQTWKRVYQWACAELHRQQSLVHSDHDAQMDPVSMAMAACLCSRLQKIAKRGELGTTNEHLTLLPSALELQHAIDLLFQKQSQSGIWPKYFPLFHYPNAGSNFCFTFEMLEAILTEFGDGPTSALDRSSVSEGLEHALEWCERNRLVFSVDEGADRVVYRGWNSGGELDSLRAGKPESWATAVVHMFLSELERVVDSRIKNLLLQSYDAGFGKTLEIQWDDLIEIDVAVQNTGVTTVKTILTDQILGHANEYDSATSKKMKGRTSALLFGPPGTSKTTLVRAFAAELKWPIVEIEPSDFLTDGIERIYSRAREVFDDLEDLSGVVVFFDEMDALVRTRGNDKSPLDVTSRFLTTSMLPKLAKLHDDKRVVFFFATNYQSEFDSAIKRPGRFDILLCIGPPSWNNKLQSLKKFLPKAYSDDDVKHVKLRLEALANGATDKSQKELLDLITFSEVKIFFDLLSKGNDIKNTLDTIQPPDFFTQLTQFSKTITVKEDVKKQYDVDKTLSMVQ